MHTTIKLGNRNGRRQAGQPGGFDTINQSLLNTNKHTSVTTSASFQVSMSNSSAGGSYTVGDSQTNVISDWGITLDNLNKWTFRQYQKFDGTTEDFPNGEVYYSASKARDKLHSLPDLSRKVLNFCTMSVFRNSKVQTGLATFNCAIGCHYYCIGIKTQWPSWHGTYWSLAYDPWTLPLSIDLTLVSQPKSD